MNKALVILNCQEQQNEIFTSLELHSESTNIVQHEFPIVIQPFDNLIRTLLIQITKHNIKNVYFVVDRNKLDDDHSMLEWMNESSIREAVELFDYLKLPGSETLNRWFNYQSLEEELDKSITLLKKHPLLPKDVNYFYKIID